MKKSMFSEGVPRANRIAVKGGAIAAAGFILALAVAPLLSERPDADPRSKRRAPRPVIDQASEELARNKADADASLPDVTPIEEISLPEAMDRTHIRSLVQQLVLAAAQDNPAFQSAMIGALGRYGSRARPILEERLASVEEPKVRDALRQALELAR